MGILKKQLIKNGSTLRRKKLWEISSGFHCSVIGICFRRSELHKLARKKVFNLSMNEGDFKMHSVLVNAATIRSEKSRTLHRLLDKKFRTAVLKFSKLNTDDELQELWEKSVEKGNIAGAYWALVTHPTIGTDLVATVYGEVHMIGHDFFGDYQRDCRLLENFENRVVALREEHELERQRNCDEKLNLENEIERLRLIEKENRILTEENEELKARQRKYDDGLEARMLGERSKQVKKLYDQNNQLRGRLERLMVEFEDSQELYELAESTVTELEAKQERLKKEKQEMQQEIISLETVLLTQAARSYGCPACEDCNTDRCPGPDLCGKTVLYVGGQHKMVPRYRQMVEKHNGRFAHHDGGKEASRAILPKMLNNADAVLCPVDCVSHYACNCVKQICKRYQKPFIIMRSSGLSSLAKGLSEILQ